MPDGATLRVLGPRPPWLRWMSLWGLRSVLVVDGVIVSEVWPGEVSVTDVRPGVHTVRLQRPRMRLLRSEETGDGCVHTVIRGYRAFTPNAAGA